MAKDELDRLWTPTNLENLARTYWRFLSRVTLGLIRVIYGSNERTVVFLTRPFTLLRFNAPEYVLEPDHGNVRWQIRGGLLVARRGRRRGCGYLSLDVRRSPEATAGRAGQAPHRGRGRELLPVDRGRLQHPGVRNDAVCAPRAGHPRVPALARQAQPRDLEDRATRRGSCPPGSGPRSRPATGPPTARRSPRISRSGRRSARAACRGRGAQTRGAPSPSVTASPATRSSRRGRPDSARPAARRRR